jgi:hypothetical protein
VAATEQVLGTETVIREVQVPYHTSQVETKEIEVEKETAKHVFREVSKVIRVEQTVPMVYKEPKFEVIEKPVHHVVMQK